jgi:hypothetical protein
MADLRPPSSRSLSSVVALRTRLPAVMVYGTCASMLAGVLVAIALWGRNLPLSEDWLMVAPLTRHEPDLLGWLWSQNNEHRLPCPAFCT